MRSLFLLKLLLVSLAVAGAARGQLVEFNESAGSSLAQVQASSGAVWATAISGVTADGTGLLSVLPHAGRDRVGALLPLASAPVSAGVQMLKVVVSGWNFAGAPNLGPVLEMGLADAAGRVVAGFKLDVNGSNVALTGSAGGAASSETDEATDQFFPLVQPAELTIKLLLDFAGGTYQISTSADGFQAATSGLLADPRRAASFVSLALREDFTLGGSGGGLALDRVSFRPLTAPDAQQVWLETYFTEPERADPAISSELADPSGGGVVNLVRFALGQNPRQRSAVPLVGVVSTPDHTVLTVRRARDPLAIGVSQWVEVSADLQTWTPLQLPVTATHDDGAGFETITLADPAPAPARRFYRLRFTRF